MHVGVHESPSGSVAVQSPTPPFPGGADASHENVTDASLREEPKTKMTNAKMRTNRARIARDER